jgi:hypothetical protein
MSILSTDLPSLTFAPPNNLPAHTVLQVLEIYLVLQPLLLLLLLLPLFFLQSSWVLRI